MKKALKFALFFTIFSGIYGGMNYYVYRSVLQPYSISGLPLLGIRLLFWFLGSAYLINQFIKRKIHLPLLSYLGATWMGVLSIALTVYLLKDILIFILPVYQGAFNRWSLAFIILLTFLSTINVLRGPKVKHIQIQHKKLEREPLSLVLLSDVHLGMMTSEKWLGEVVDQVNGLKADFIVITGDLVDDSFEVVKRFVPIIKKMNSKYGTYAVAGNHEHYQGIEHFEKFLKASDITLLNNESLTLAEKINLIGLDDEAVTGGSLVHSTELVLQKCDPALFNVLLVHQPVGFPEAAKNGVDLQLSGHTHRGQIPPLNFLVHLVYKYAYGLSQIDDSYIYTTSGTGTWGPPMRLFSSSEIVKIQIN